jgi:galactonate dehydratase
MSSSIKITGVKTVVVNAEMRNWVFVKVETDTELHGWGEATLEGKEETVRTCVHELGQALIGQDPLAVEHHWQALYRNGFWQSVGRAGLPAPGRPDPPAHPPVHPRGHL